MEYLNKTMYKYNRKLAQLNSPAETLSDQNNVHSAQTTSSPSIPSLLTIVSTH